MYVPPPYQEARRDVMLAAIAARSFGTLITAGTAGAAGLKITHVPFALIGDFDAETLIAHVARSNPQWKDIADGAETVASFLVDDAYISPGWYPSKAETGKVVPTWNYVAVEVRGTAAVVEDQSQLLELVNVLTARHERGRSAPWSTEDAPADYTKALLRGIVGVRLHINELTGAWKLDQKKHMDDRLGAAERLSSETPAKELAALMRNLT
jgi:transcriptional regulator